jgi:hypothetical protein
VTQSRLSIFEEREAVEVVRYQKDLLPLPKAGLSFACDTPLKSNRIIPKKLKFMAKIADISIGYPFFCRADASFRSRIEKE